MVTTKLALTLGGVILATLASALPLTLIDPGTIAPVEHSFPSTYSTNNGNTVKIAFWTAPNINDTYGSSIWLYDNTQPSGSQFIKISTGVAEVCRPRISRDGKAVTFLGSFDGTPSKKIPYVYLIGANPVLVHPDPATVGSKLFWNPLTSSWVPGPGELTKFSTSPYDRPPAITDLWADDPETEGNDAGFEIYWDDMCFELAGLPGQAPATFTPIMRWTVLASTSGGQVGTGSAVDGTDTYTRPSVSSYIPSTGQPHYLIACQGSPQQVKRFQRTTRNAATYSLINTVSSYYGTLGNGNSDQSECDATGSIIAFRTQATNLRASDINLMDDIYVRNMANLYPTLGYKDVSASGNGAVKDPSISSNGLYLGFLSNRTDFYGSTQANLNPNGYTGDFAVWSRFNNTAVSIPSRTSTGYLRGANWMDASFNGLRNFSSSHGGIVTGDDTTSGANPRDPYFDIITRND